MKNRTKLTKRALIHSAHAQQGTSLIEVLVTLLVLSIGLLGIAGLQANSAVFMRVSQQRAEAAQAAYELSDRMRGNLDAFRAGNYTYKSTYNAAPPGYPPCTEGCSPAQIATIDQIEWITNLQNRIPGGYGYVDTKVVNGKTYAAITVMWRESNFTTEDTSCPSGAFATRIPGIRCMTIEIIP